MSFWAKLKNKISNTFNKISNTFNKIFKRTISISNNSNVKIFQPKQKSTNFFRPYIPKSISNKSTVDLQKTGHKLYERMEANKLTKEQWKKLHHIDIEIKRRSYRNETDNALKQVRKDILEQAVGNFKGSSYKSDKQQFSNMSYAKNGTIAVTYADYVYSELGIKHSVDKLTAAEKEKIRANIAKWQPLKQGAQYGYILVEEAKVNSPVDIDEWNI